MKNYSQGSKPWGHGYGTAKKEDATIIIAGVVVMVLFHVGFFLYTKLKKGSKN